MNCLKLTFSPFVATSDLGLGLTPGELYYRSDQKVAGTDASCKHLVGIPHRRTADGKIGLQACGGTPYAGKYFLACPSTKPDQWVAEMPCGLGSTINVTFMAGPHNTFSARGLSLDCSCFAGTYTLYLNPFLQGGDAPGSCYYWGLYDDEFTTPLPSSCQTVAPWCEVIHTWASRTDWADWPFIYGLLAKFAAYAGTMRVGFHTDYVLFWSPRFYFCPQEYKSVFCGTVLPTEPAPPYTALEIGFYMDTPGWPEQAPEFDWDHEYQLFVKIRRPAGGHSQLFYSDQWTVRFTQ